MFVVIQSSWLPNPIKVILNHGHHKFVAIIATAVRKLNFVAADSYRNLISCYSQYNLNTIAYNHAHTVIQTRNSSGDEIAKRDFSVYLFILQLYINSCIINK